MRSRTQPLTGINYIELIEGVEEEALIYVKSEILSFDVALTHLKAKDIEQMWTIIRYGKDSILLGSINRPHDLDDKYLTRTIETIKTAKYALKSLKCTNMLLYGTKSRTRSWDSVSDQDKESSGYSSNHGKQSTR